MQRRHLLAGLAALASATLALPTLAQSRPSAPGYPVKPIRIVVPYPAGGASDFVARLLGERLSKAWGQPFIVENRTGASGSLGAAEVARAAPDGYTWLVTIGDALINNQLLFKHLPYQPDTDFAFVSQVVHSPAILSASRQLGVKDMADFAALAKRDSRGLSYGSWGMGGLGHLAGEALNQSLGADMVHVPQRGESAVMTDLLSNTLSVGLTSAGLAKQHIQAGNVVPLAIMGAERVPGMETIPTIRELGYDDPIFDAAVWLGVLTPAGVPQPILEIIEAGVRDVARQTDVRTLLLDRGLIVTATTSGEFRARFERESDVILGKMTELKIEAQ